MMPVVSPLNPFIDFDTYFAINRLYEKRYHVPNNLSQSRHISSVADILDEFDAVILDSHGVLTTGDVIEPALSSVRLLRDAGKKLCILSNDGNASKKERLDKYHKMGFSFKESELVNGLDLLEEMLKNSYPKGMCWGGLYSQTLSHAERLENEFGLKSLPKGELNIEEADGFILFTAGVIEPDLVEKVAHSLKKNPRPFIVANPDIAAPTPQGLYITPGYYACKIEEICGIEPVQLGKPDQRAYAAVCGKWEDIPAERILMVGDTLHTDILGGMLAGMKTMLVTSGVYNGRDDLDEMIEKTGIVPNFIAPNL